MSFDPGALEAVIPFGMGVFATVVGFSKKYDTPQWARFRRLKWLGPALMVFGIFTFCRTAQTPPESIEGIAAQIRSAAHLPVKVDEETIFSDVQPLDGNRLGFYFTLASRTHDAPDLPEIMKAMRESLKSRACMDQNYLAFLRKDIPLSIIYSGSDGIRVERIDFEPSDCPS